MAALRRVMFVPVGAVPPVMLVTAAAGEEQAPDEEAWLATSRRVCESFSAGLAAADPAGLTNRASRLNLRTWPAGEELATGAVVVAEVHVDRVWEGGEFAHVHVPRGTAKLSPAQRAELVLHTVHAVVCTLGTYRRWDRTVLDRVRDDVSACGSSFGWSSAWKSSPGRRRRARVVYQLADDGLGRAMLEVQDGDGPAVRTDPAAAYPTPEGFRRSARTLRWSGPDDVAAIPFCSPFLEAGLVRWSTTGGGSAEPSPAPAAEPSELLVLDGDLASRVVVRAVGDSLPDRPAEIRVVGGGPMNDVPGAYVMALKHLLDLVSGPEWIAWWGASGETLLEIWYNFAPRRPGVWVRRADSATKATLARETSTIVAATDPVLLALDDVTALVAAVRNRFRLADPPSLPSRDEV